MKIEQLNGQRATVCRNSIKVLNEDGKTAGVITNAYPLQAREASQVWSAYRAALGTGAAGAINRTRHIDGRPVYIANARSEKERAEAEALKAAGIATALYIPAESAGALTAQRRHPARARARHAPTRGQEHKQPPRKEKRK